MANLLTRIPEGPPPPLPSWMKPAVWAGDWTMWLMFSRPNTGSLSNTWVTPATLMLAIPVAIACFVFSGLTIANADSALRVSFAVALCLISLGALAVSLVGILQRMASQGPPIVPPS